jgi:hypothetical protein
MKSQNANVFTKMKNVFVATLVVTLLPKLKEDIEPVEDEVWSVSRHCHVLNNQQPPLRLHGLVSQSQTWLDFIEISETSRKFQIAKSFIKIHISNPKLRILHLPVEVKIKNYKNQFTQKANFFPMRRVGVKWQLTVRFACRKPLQKVQIGKDRDIFVWSKFA